MNKCPFCGSDEELVSIHMTTYACGTIMYDNKLDTADQSTYCLAAVATNANAKAHTVPLPKWNPVSKPKHYNSHPSGIECIQVTEHMDFCIGNAIKYLWRTDHKNGIEDLKKAIWYIERKIALLEKTSHD